MKVYVITSGIYSDYHIVGVLLDKEEAEEKAQILSNHDTYYNYEVEEYDTECLQTLKPGDSVWRCRFSLKTHRLLEVEKIIYSELIWGEVHTNFTSIATVDVYASNEREAVKKGSDKFHQFLAEKMGL